MDNAYLIIHAGSVEYDKTVAAVDIDQLISELEEAREDGATHVLGLSGNSRGARYVQLTVGDIEYNDEDGE